MKTKSTLFCIVALCWSVYLAGCGGGSAAPPQPPPAPTFTLTGSMTTPRVFHTATLLNTGKVLVTGGFLDNVSPPTNSAEIYDPATGAFSAITSMVKARSGHTATLLQDSTVLIAGGGINDDASAEIFDPAAGTFVLLPVAMSVQRNFHTATLLPDGKVLLAGGEDNAGLTVTNTAELYDRVNRAFLPTASTMLSPRWFHTATLLPSPAGSGRPAEVLIAGGFSDSSELALDSAEAYDLPSNTFFGRNESMSSPRGQHTATFLNGNIVLIAGGFDQADPSTSVLFATAELFDNNFLTFAPTGSMSHARFLHTASLLKSGQVLVAGGSGGILSGILASAELYGAATGSFTAAATMNQARAGHIATVLQSGNVLVTGGFDSSLNPSASAEIYH